MAEFTNPNQPGASGGMGGGDNKSLILMMIVMVGVFFGLQFYRSKTTQPTVISKPSQSATQPAAPALPQPMQAADPASSAAPSAIPAIQATADSTTVVENELYRITFSNRGGSVLSWILKSQKDADGKPLDLVHAQSAAAFGHPLSLYTYDAATTAAVNQALYLPSATGALAAPGSLTFRYAANGLEVTKTFTFDETPT